MTGLSFLLNFAAMKFILILVVSFSFFSQNPSAAERADTLFIIISPSSEFPPAVHPKNWKERFVDHLKTKYGEDNKTVAAVLAFPLPFGFVGLHRIYLGTKPYVPVVYIATLGGCAGLLPLIDFISILAADKETFQTFRNDPRVFMWAK
jgi:hypothetical protein